MEHSIKIVWILTIGFALASFFGYVAQKAKLPTMLGFLLAGYIIGPHFPGFAADAALAEQLAEVGVVLMLFSVGLHFKLEDLFKVKKVAIPGAIVQTTVATLVTVILAKSLGWTLQSGVILGLAIGVASTFVLARILSDNHLLDTRQGHIAIGWLIVEDIFTVIVLALLPLMAAYNQAEQASSFTILTSISWVFVKFTVLCLILFTIGAKAVTLILTRIAQTRSQELFTLTILALVFLIAASSYLIFGTSLALGAFIAGMMIGKTNVKHQAAANALSLKDTFTILFFLSVGMLLDPLAVQNHLSLFLGVMGVILIAKPLAAFFLILAFRLPLKIALTVALALAQIGEFSFILAEQANTLKLLPDEAYDVIVICALLSICINPLLFRGLNHFEHALYKVPFLRRIYQPKKQFEAKEQTPFKQKAIVVGYGPIGQAVTKILQEYSYSTVVIEHNIDTVSKHRENIQIIFGDASFQDLLAEAHVEDAELLIITVEELDSAERIISSARQTNPRVKILTRVTHLRDIEKTQDMKVHYVCCEKESVKAFQEALIALDLGSLYQGRFS